MNELFEMTNKERAEISHLPKMVINLRCISQQTDVNQDGQLPELTEDTLTAAQQLQSLDQKSLAEILDKLNDSELIGVIYFYTRAEDYLTGFSTGSDNLAIAIFQYLKKNRGWTDREQIKALKKETKNRFIPYGDVLL